MTITDIAKKEINTILAQNKGKSLRVYMAGFGWGGPSLGMALDESKEKDNKYQINGIDILISEQDKNSVNDFNIDFVDDYRGKGLVIQSAGAC